MTAAAPALRRTAQRRATIAVTAASGGGVLIAAGAVMSFAALLGLQPALEGPGTALAGVGAGIVLVAFVWLMRSTAAPDATTWRARRVAWHRFRRTRRRSLIVAEAAVLAAVAVAVPLYLQLVGYQWRLGGGRQVRELPPNVEPVLSWALWTATVGATVAAAVAVGLVAARLLRQLRTPPAQWRRVPAAAHTALMIGALWAVSSMTTTGVIVNGLVMT